jgi:hypothetical protein
MEIEDKNWWVKHLLSKKQFFKTGSLYVTQAGLKLNNLLSRPSSTGYTGV